MKTDVLIIGGGLSGLACALSLQSAGVECMVAESESEPGGRVGSVQNNGFIIDKGFQVILSSYPEIKNFLPNWNSQMSYFRSGAILESQAGPVDLFHPLFHPRAFWTNPKLYPFSISDLVALTQWLAKSFFQGDNFFHQQPGISTRLLWDRANLSEKSKSVFFKPFFEGVLLDAPLETDSGYFLWLLKQFFSGKAGLPPTGMKAFPEALAQKLSKGVFLSNHRLIRQEGKTAQFENGNSIQFSRLVMANGSAPSINPLNWHSAYTLYLKGPSSVDLPDALILNGIPSGNIRHLCFPSVIQPAYAPKGWALCSVSLKSDFSKISNFQEVILELRQIFPQVNWESWEFLDNQVIRHALPQFTPGNEKPFLQEGNTWWIGDRFSYPSINGALLSGRKAAEDILRRII